jgi:hypothetical protein
MVSKSFESINFFSPYKLKEIINDYEHKPKWDNIRRIRTSLGHTNFGLNDIVYKCWLDVCCIVVMS